MLFFETLLFNVLLYKELFLFELGIDLNVFTDLTGLEADGAEVTLTFCWLDDVDFFMLFPFIGDPDLFFFLVDLLLKGLS